MGRVTTLPSLIKIYFLIWTIIFNCKAQPTWCDMLFSTKLSVALYSCTVLPESKFWEWLKMTRKTRSEHSSCSNQMLFTEVLLRISSKDSNRRGSNWSPWNSPRYNFRSTVSVTLQPLHGFRKLYIYSCFVSLKASKELLEQHYEELKDKKFFPGLVNYMSSGPVVPMVWKLFV